MSSFEIHPNGGSWKVKHAETAEILADLKLQDVAIDFARELAQRSPPSRVVLLAPDGRIQKEWAFARRHWRN